MGRVPAKWRCLEDGKAILRRKCNHFEMNLFIEVT